MPESLWMEIKYKSFFIPVYVGAHSQKAGLPSPLPKEAALLLLANRKGVFNQSPCEHIPAAERVHLLER